MQEPEAPAPRSTPDRLEMYARQDDILVAITSVGMAGKPLRDEIRRELYRLPKWRALMIAKLAYRCRRLQRYELDEIARLCRVTPGTWLPMPKELREH